MGDTKEPLSLGLASATFRQLQEGDELTFELNSSGKDVDTEWGIQNPIFHNRTHRQNSSLDIKPGAISLEYVMWRSSGAIQLFEQRPAPGRIKDREARPYP